MADIYSHPAAVVHEQFESAKELLGVVRNIAQVGEATADPALREKLKPLVQRLIEIADRIEANARASADLLKRLD